MRRFLSVLATVICAAIHPAAGPAAAWDLQGTVLDADTGQPLPNAEVVLLRTRTRADEEGRFRFSGMAEDHDTAVTLHVFSGKSANACERMELTVPFFPVAAAHGERMAVAIVEADVDSDVTLRVERVPPAEINSFCTRCHGGSACLEVPGNVRRQRSTLAGAWITREEALERTKQLTRQAMDKETYARLRYMDTHAAPMDMVEMTRNPPDRIESRYRSPEDLKLLDDGHTSCETCHTRHLPTEQRSFVVLPFENSALCEQCHL